MVNNNYYIRRLGFFQQSNKYLRLRIPETSHDSDNYSFAYVGVKDNIPVVNYTNFRGSRFSVYIYKERDNLGIFVSSSSTEGFYIWYESGGSWLGPFNETKEVSLNTIISLTGDYRLDDAIDDFMFIIEENVKAEESLEDVATNHEPIITPKPSEPQPFQSAPSQPQQRCESDVIVVDSSDDEGVVLEKVCRLPKLEANGLSKLEPTSDNESDNDTEILEHAETGNTEPVGNALIHELESSSLTDVNDPTVEQTDSTLDFKPPLPITPQSTPGAEFDSQELASLTGDYSDPVPCPVSPMATQDLLQVLDDDNLPANDNSQSVATAEANDFSVSAAEVVKHRRKSTKQMDGLQPEPKKRRGRPPKDPNAPPKTKKSQSNSSGAKKRMGRPPKQMTLKPLDPKVFSDKEDSDPGIVRPIRIKLKRKNPIIESDDNDNDDENEKQSQPIKVSRRRGTIADALPASCESPQKKMTPLKLGELMRRKSTVGAPQPSTSIANLFNNNQDNTKSCEKPPAVSSASSEAKSKNNYPISTRRKSIVERESNIGAPQTSVSTAILTNNNQDKAKSREKPPMVSSTPSEAKSKNNFSILTRRKSTIDREELRTTFMTSDSLEVSAVIEDVPKASTSKPENILFATGPRERLGKIDARSPDKHEAAKRVAAALPKTNVAALPKINQTPSRRGTNEPPKTSNASPSHRFYKEISPVKNAIPLGDPKKFPKTPIRRMSVSAPKHLDEISRVKHIIPMKVPAGRPVDKPVSPPRPDPPQTPLNTFTADSVVPNIQIEEVNEAPQSTPRVELFKHGPRRRKSVCAREPDEQQRTPTPPTPPSEQLNESRVNKKLDVKVNKQPPMRRKSIAYREQEGHSQSSTTKLTQPMSSLAVQHSPPNNMNQNDAFTLSQLNLEENSNQSWSHLTQPALVDEPIVDEPIVESIAKANQQNVVNTTQGESPMRARFGIRVEGGNKDTEYQPIIPPNFVLDPRGTQNQSSAPEVDPRLHNRQQNHLYGKSFHPQLPENCNQGMDHGIDPRLQARQPLAPLSNKTSSDLRPVDMELGYPESQNTPPPSSNRSISDIPLPATRSSTVEQGVIDTNLIEKRDYEQRVTKERQDRYVPKKYKTPQLPIRASPAQVQTSFLSSSTLSTSSSGSSHLGSPYDREHNNHKSSKSRHRNTMLHQLGPPVLRDTPLIQSPSPSTSATDTDNERPPALQPDSQSDTEEVKPRTPNTEVSISPETGEALQEILKWHAQTLMGKEKMPPNLPVDKIRSVYRNVDAYETAMKNPYLYELYEVMYNSYQRKKDWNYIDMTVTFPSICRQGALSCLIADICYDFKTSLGIPSPTAYLIIIENKKRGGYSLGYIDQSFSVGKIQTQAKIWMLSDRGDFRTGEKLQFKLVKYVLHEVHTLTAIKSLRSSPLCDQIIDPVNISVFKSRAAGELKTGDQDLLLSQTNTIKMICNKMVDDERFGSISILEGPPATGKTRVAANIVLQAILGEKVIKDPRVLVCATSSAAADTFTKKLDELIKPKMNLKLVRADYLDRICKELREFDPSCLARAKLDDDIKGAIERVSKDVPLQKKRRLILNKLEEIKGNFNKDELDRVKRDLERVEFEIYRLKNKNNKGMKKEDVLREQIEIILTTANIVVTTPDYCGVLFDLAKGNNFNICVFDDANVASEIFTLKPLIFNVSHLVLVGDAELTPPKMKSTVASKNLLHQSIFHRIKKCITSNSFGTQDSTYKLNIQFRMPEQILHFINRYLYNNAIESQKDIINDRMDGFEFKQYAIMTLPEELKEGLNFLQRLLRKIDSEIHSICVLVADERRVLEVKNYIRSDTIHFCSIDTIQSREFDFVVLFCDKGIDTADRNIDQWVKIAFTRASHSLFVCLDEAQTVTGGPKDDVQSDLFRVLVEDAKKRGLFFTEHQMDIFK